jgi:hypothetical protein
MHHAGVTFGYFPVDVSWSAPLPSFAVVESENAMGKELGQLPVLWVKYDGVLERDMVCP